MEIEILTTKKKLSASFIKQMPFICPEKFDNISFLGGLRNVRSKDSYVILCQNSETKQFFLLNTGYYILEAATKEATITVRWNTNPVLTFENQQKRDEWYSKYQSIIKEVSQIFV